MGGTELGHVQAAFDKNFIAPIGPQLDAFEAALASYIGQGVHVSCVSSGTAALHLALHMEQLETGDEVWLSSMTFAGGVFPVNYVGATPVFFDLDPASWTISADLVEEELVKRAKINKLPKVVVATDLYGQTCDYDRLERLSEKFGFKLIIDAAESMGAKYRNRNAGYAGKASILSFNGNKMMTTGGGGAFLSRDSGLVKRARFLATQARDPAPHYEHSVYGFNYRMGNIPASIGLGQLDCLSEHVSLRKRIFNKYRIQLNSLESVEFMPEADWGGHSRWLTTVRVNLKGGRVYITDIESSLSSKGIEVRRLWKPMHLQPLYKDAAYIGAGFDEELFKTGLCLPSSSNMTNEEQDCVIQALEEVLMYGRSG
jgi:pyridoxal phosphate-dependent aminotransferase EpsN